MLSALIGGVVVAALITSLNVSSSTATQVGDSSDAALISGFLVRDAQSAGATDPTTAAHDASVGVSNDTAAPAMSDCAPPPSFILRFSWIDHEVPVSITQTGTRVVAYYTFDTATAELTRRLCKHGVSSDVAARQPSQAGRRRV